MATGLAKLDDATFARLDETSLEYAPLLFPGQHLSKAEPLAFAKRFGDLEFALAPISAPHVRAAGCVRAPVKESGVPRPTNPT